MVIVLMPGATANYGALDLGELYRALGPRLERIVSSNVCASHAVVEDACQFAWGRLLQHADRVHRDAVLSWLATTAVREAHKLICRRAREVALEDFGDAPPAASAPAPEVVIEQRERLASVGVLSERQQRLLWLHALGLSYAEISRHTGCTPRTVERQLLRAKRRLREADS